MNGMRVLTVIERAMSCERPVTTGDYNKLSVLLRFQINSTPIWRLENVASGKASNDYTALGI